MLCKNIFGVKTIFISKYIPCWNFPCSLVLRLHLPMQRVAVQSLVGELRSHMPQGGVARNFKIIIKCVKINSLLVTQQSIQR